MSHFTRVCTITPAYNEEETIQKVIDQIGQHLPNSQTVVINDGSRDKTSVVAQQAGAVVVDLPFNLGIGGAVQTGLRFANQNDFDVAIEIDADGQHDPAFLPILLEELETEGADMVIGSRFVKSTEYRSSIMRRFGIHLFSFLIKLITGRRIYDSTSGYRAYSKRALSFLAQRYPSDFPEPESIVMLLNAGFKVKEVPVEMAERQGGESVIGKSDFSWKGAYFVISNAIAILISGLKPKRHVR